MALNLLRHFDASKNLNMTICGVILRNLLLKLVIVAWIWLHVCVQCAENVEMNGVMEATEIVSYNTILLLGWLFRTSFLCISIPFIRWRVYNL